MSRSRRIVSEYKHTNREAVILDTAEGLEVDLYRNEYLIETRKVYDHNQSYAESLAENWVLKVFTWLINIGKGFV